MAPQDNGPRNGDFVRYIAELNAKSALAAKTTPVPTDATTRTATPSTVVARPGPTRSQTSQAGQLGIPALAGAGTITIAAIVVGGIAIAVGVLVQSLSFFLILGVALVVWALRRTTTARRTPS